MSNALLCLARYERPGLHSNERRNALRLYYYFANGVWYDNWKSPKIEKSKPSITYNTPIELPNYRESESRYIIYDRDVEKLDRIHGLTGFIESEYPHIIDTIGQFIPEEDAHKYHEIPVHQRCIPILLSKDTPTQKYTESDEYIAKKIARLLREDINDIEPAILEILKNKSHTERVLGRYYHDGAQEYFDNSFRFEDGSYPYIVIYYKNTNCPDFSDYKALIKNCLAHEYFHFIHNYSIGYTFYKKNTHRKDIVEGSADFYSIIYSLFHPSVSDEELAEKKYYRWKERLGSSWPYANAYYFYIIRNLELPFSSHIDERLVEKFKEVFKASHHNMNDAYNVLIR